MIKWISALILITLLTSCKTGCNVNSYNVKYQKYNIKYNKHRYLKDSEYNTINWYERNNKPYKGANAKRLYKK